MRTLRLLLLVVILALPTGSVWGGNQVSRSVVAAGGGSSVSSNHVCAGTVGQPTVAGASSPSYSAAAGFWSSSGVAVGIDNTGEPPVPSVYRLHQNVPNPLTTTTVIRYDVPEDGARIALRIHDLRGALVRVLADGPQSAGEKSVIWDGRDDRGERSVAGIYLCVLNTPKQRLIRKLAVLQ